MTVSWRLVAGAMFFVSLSTGCALLGDKEVGPLTGLSSVCAPTRDAIALISPGQIELDDGERWEDITLEFTSDRPLDVTLGVGTDEFGAGSAVYVDEIPTAIDTSTPLDVSGPGSWPLTLLVDGGEPLVLSIDHVTYRSGGRLHRSTEDFELTINDGACDDERLGDEG